jgi:hypothetical protein
MAAQLTEHTAPLSAFGVLLNAEHDHRSLMALARTIEGLGFGTLWYAD